MSNNKQSIVELINKWKANPNEFGVYDIIGDLSWLAKKYNNQDAKKLANEIIENEEYEINYLINLVEKRLIKDSGHFWDELTGELIQNSDMEFHPYSHEDEILIKNSSKPRIIDIKKLF